MLKKRFPLSASLDILRQNRGNQALKTHFRDLVMEDTSSALKLLNDSNLHFPTLFLLLPDSQKFGLIPKLSTRNACAAALIHRLLETKVLDIKSIDPKGQQELYSLMQWVFLTGLKEDGLSDSYDQVLDGVVLLLIKEYRDTASLPSIIDLLFQRYRRGSYTYDLIWALFESRSPNFLLKIPPYMHSPHFKDRELALKLLSFLPESNFDLSRNHPMDSKVILKWLKENYLFMEYTGETYHQSCHPRPYVLSLEAKYLCKPVYQKQKATRREISGNEKNNLEKFRNLGEEDKALLSEVSYFLYRKSKDRWKRWMEVPIEKQMAFPKIQGGFQ